MFTTYADIESGMVEICHCRDLAAPFLGAHAAVSNLYNIVGTRYVPTITVISGSVRSPYGVERLLEAGRLDLPDLRKLICQYPFFLCGI